MPEKRGIVDRTTFVTLQGLKLSLPTAARDAIVVGSVRTSIRTAWLVYAHNPIDAAMAALIDAERAKLKRIPGADHWHRENARRCRSLGETIDRHVLELACQ